MKTLKNAAQYLATNVKNIRLKKSLSQSQLADLAEVTRSTLTNIESGQSNPSLSNIIKVSTALGVSIEEMLSRPRSEHTLTKASDIPIVLKNRGDVRIFKLLPDKIRGLDIDRIELPPKLSCVDSHILLVQKNT